MAPMPLLNGGGFCSPSTPSPEPSFRELDDAFLQNQTRIWLGEVLNMRLDKDVNISDLLADGQILFRAYKLFQRMIISQDHTSRQKFLKRESIASSEIAEIFPYAKVNCFLEVCQMLGVSDVDLFTTSDVVDKRNTRKVCMCLRSLAKKARSRNLNVPDFDSVTHRRKSPVTMPTDMVGNRRRNLERSSGSSGAIGHDPSVGPRRTSSLGDFGGFHADSTSYKSDVSEDDIESNDVVGESLEASTDFSATGTSPRTPDPSMAGDFSFAMNDVEHLNMEEPHRHSNAETTESVGDTPPSQGPESGFGDNFEQIDDHPNHKCENNTHNQSPVHLDWQDDSSALENGSGGDIVEKTDENADLPVTSLFGEKEKFPGNGVEPDNATHQLHSNLEVGNVDDAEAMVDNSGESNLLPVETRCAETMDQGELSGGPEIRDEANSQTLVDAKELPHHTVNGDKVVQSNPPKKMLKLVAGGTGTVAVVGLLLFWLQLRKKGSENAAAGSNLLLNPIRSAGTQKQKQEKGGTNRIYPADKLNFGA